MVIEHRHALFDQFSCQTTQYLCKPHVDWLAYNVKVFNESKSLSRLGDVFLTYFFKSTSPIMLVKLKVLLGLDFKFLEFHADIVKMWPQTVYEVRLLNRLDLLITLK